MTKHITAFIFGLTFGLGLIIAQMTNPDKVLAFLDVTGDWDPSLALVMASALLVLGIAQRRITSSPDTDQEQLACENSKNGIDAKLIVGAAIFGVGWGLSGICPGPAIVGLSSGLPGFYVFTGSLFAGFLLFKYFHRQD